MSSYNNVFERLMSRAEVAGEPLVGMVAYSIYKKSKANRCKKAFEDGKSLTLQELQTYHQSFDDILLGALETEARESLFRFVEVIQEQEKPKIIQDAIGGLTKSIETRDSDIKKHITNSTHFWKGFWPGFASSTAFFLVAGAIAFIYAINNADSIQSVINKLPNQNKAVILPHEK